jgi:hypothetical protein
MIGVQELGKACPADTPAFPATPIEPRECPFHGPGKEARECAGVPLNSIIAIMSPEPSLEAVEEGSTRQMPVRLNPFLAPFAHALQFLVSGTACDPRPFLSVFCPEQFAAPKGEPARHARMKAPEAQDAGLLR